MDTAIYNSELLDSAVKLFDVCEELGADFQAELDWRATHLPDESFRKTRHNRRIAFFYLYLFKLRDATENSPQGFEPIAKIVKQAMKIARHLREEFESPLFRDSVAYLRFYSELRAIGSEGHERVTTHLIGLRNDDPFAFVDTRTSGQVDLVEGLPMSLPQVQNYSMHDSTIPRWPVTREVEDAACQSQQLDVEARQPKHSNDPTGETPAGRERTPGKRRTPAGNAKHKLISALTMHHQYAKGNFANQEPIGNNALAKMAGVAASTASDFFKKQFEGHEGYEVLCRDAQEVIGFLKILNNEFTPRLLLGNLDQQIVDTG